MVTSKIYSKELQAGHEQAASRSSGEKMFVCMCRCADVNVCQEKKKKKKQESEYSVTFKVLISGSQPLI